MSAQSQVVELLGDPSGRFIHKEALADEAILVGALLEKTSSGTVQNHSTAASNAQKMFALTNPSTGGGIADAYADGERVRYGMAHSGQGAMGLVAASATAITVGAALESAGNGTLRIASADAASDTSQRDAIVGYADEAVDNSGGATTVYINFTVA